MAGSLDTPRLEIKAGIIAMNQLCGKEGIGNTQSGTKKIT
jgi:hypothetical protein